MAKNMVRGGVKLYSLFRSGVSSRGSGGGVRGTVGGAKVIG